MPRLLSVALLLLSSSLTAAPPEKFPDRAETAWKELVRTHPGIVDDEAVSPLERRLLDRLTPAAADAYLEGADPSQILLTSGESIVDFVAAHYEGIGPSLAYVPVDPCRVMATWFVDPSTKMAADEVRGFAAKGADLSSQGGSATGCGVPAEAVALMVHYRVTSPEAEGYLKAWSADAPQPALPVVDHRPTAEMVRFNSAGALSICATACGGDDFKLKTALTASHVRVDTVGYFRPLTTADVPGGSGSGLDADTLDGLDSTAFAAAAHTHDGSAIVSGSVAESFLDAAVARDAEIVPTVLANDGAGSTLDADTLDGLDSTDFLTAGELAEESLNPLRVAALRWYESNNVASSFAVGTGPRQVLFDGFELWVTNFDSDNVTRLRPSDGRFVETVLTGDGPSGMAFDGAHLWVAATNAGRLNKLRTSDSMALSNVTVGTSPVEIAFDGTSLWVTNQGSNSVMRVDPVANAVTGTFAVGNSPTGLAFDGESVWVANRGSDTVTRLSTADGSVLGTFAVGDEPRDVVYDGSSVWVTNFLGDSVTRLDAADGSLRATLPVGNGPIGVVFDGSAVWVSNTLDGTVSKLSTSDGSLLSTVTLPAGSAPRGGASDGIHVWFASTGLDQVNKL